MDGDLIGVASAAGLIIFFLLASVTFYSFRHCVKTFRNKWQERQRLKEEGGGGDGGNQNKMKEQPGTSGNGTAFHLPDAVVWSSSDKDVFDTAKASSTSSQHEDPWTFNALPTHAQDTGTTRADIHNPYTSSKHTPYSGMISSPSKKEGVYPSSHLFGDANDRISYKNPLVVDASVHKQNGDAYGRLRNESYEMNELPTGKGKGKGKGKAKGKGKGNE